MNYLAFDAVMFLVGIVLSLGVLSYTPSKLSTHKWLFFSGVGLGFMLYVMMIRFLSGYA